MVKTTGLPSNRFTVWTRFLPACWDTYYYTSLNILFITLKMLALISHCKQNQFHNETSKMASFITWLYLTAEMSQAVSIGPFTLTGIAYFMRVLGHTRVAIKRYNHKYF